MPVERWLQARHIAFMKVETDMRIRPAELSDRDFILSLLPRLVEFGPPPWRNSAQMTAADAQVLDGVLSTNPKGTTILIAEDDSGTPLGFIHLNTSTDYYTREEHGHISDIVVAAAGEGRGIGRALMAAGERWARNQGYRWLTLRVFAENLRARKLYEELRYRVDTINYIKELP